MSDTFSISLLLLLSHFTLLNLANSQPLTLSFRCRSQPKPISHQQEHQQQEQEQEESSGKGREQASSSYIYRPSMLLNPTAIAAGKVN
ncbi:hypothetical protein ACLKA6_008612 [Drosophila palustris]